MWLVGTGTVTTTGGGGSVRGSDPVEIEDRVTDTRWVGVSFTEIVGVPRSRRRTGGAEVCNERGDVGRQVRVAV